jgi:hypothetical protein
MSPPAASADVACSADSIAELRTGPARRAFLGRFVRQVDPEGRLPARERARLAHLALCAHMAALGRASGRARQEGKAAANADA